MSNLEPQLITKSRIFLLSIITVVFNNKKGLYDTYLSLTSQQPIDYQWVVIDGASTDGTIELLRSLDIPNLDWISSPDLGIYDAMNKGALRSQAKYLLFLNSGDQINPFSLAKVRDDLISDASLSIHVYGTYVCEQDKSDSKFAPNPDKLTSYMSVYHSSTVIPKCFFMELNGYNLTYKLASDYDLLLRAYLRGFPFLSSIYPLSRYYRGGASDMHLVRSRFEAIFSLWLNNSPSRLRGTFIMLKSLIFSLHAPTYNMLKRLAHLAYKVARLQR